MSSQNAGQFAGRGRRASRVPRGVTLAETATVVTTIAIIAGVLLPALDTSREGERTAACLNNLKLMGQATALYVADHRGSLPGPTVPNVPSKIGDEYPPTVAAQNWARVYLTFRLEPYLRGDEPGGKRMDTLAQCPTADGIACAGNAGLLWIYKPRSYYVANTGANLPTLSPNRQGKLPYYATNPSNYFGQTSLGSGGPNYDPAYAPKRLDAIPNTSREWAIADLWYGLTAEPRVSGRLAGTWPYVVNQWSSGSVVNAGELRVPSYPFHMTTQVFPSSTTSVPPTSPRLNAGRTNTVYFDAHAASVRPWVGTVNPCFSTDNCLK